MPYKVAIQNNETKEIRFYIDNDDWQDTFLWAWTEGNYGCDCNRELFFRRAAGEPFCFSELKCSEDRYTVLYIELPDQTRINVD